MPAIPTVHLNGTNGAELRDRLLDAVIALRAAMNAMYDAAPHGRDYYVQGDGATSAAMREHADRLAIVGEVARELETICEGVLAQLEVSAGER